MKTGCLFKPGAVNVPIAKQLMATVRCLLQPPRGVRSAFCMVKPLSHPRRQAWPTRFSVKRLRGKLLRPTPRAWLCTCGYGYEPTCGGTWGRNPPRRNARRLCPDTWAASSSLRATSPRNKQTSSPLLHVPNKSVLWLQHERTCNKRDDMFLAQKR